MIRLVLFTVVVLISSACKKQTCGSSPISALDSVNVDSVSKYLGTFSNFQIVNSTILILTDSGKLFSLPIGEFRASPNILSDSVTAFTVGADGDVYVSREKGSVYRLTNSRSRHNVASIDSTIHVLRFNSKNSGYAITDRGIVSLSNSKLFFPDSLQNKPFILDNFWSNPSCAFVDTEDNLWVGFNYGEWGGNIVVFDTKTDKFNMIDFDTLRPSLTPIMSLFEGKDGVIYATSGLMHFEISGELLLYKILELS